ncbi:MAG: biotin/lipoyl-containing protein, partial [Myxococcales bacterium]
MSMVEIKVPDIGDFKDVPIIQVFVKPGDAVKQEDPLIALESDKATMDVPSPAAGTVKDLKVKVGDRVSKGNLILLLDSAAEAKAAPSGPSGGNGQSAATTQAAAPAPKAEARGDKQKQPEEERPKPGEGPEKTAGPPPAKPEPKAEAPARSAPTPIESEAFKRAHASPSVRKFARELGVDLSQVKGSG